MYTYILQHFYPYIKHALGKFVACSILYSEGQWKLYKQLGYQTALSYFSLYVLHVKGTSTQKLGHFYFRKGVDTRK